MKILYFGQLVDVTKTGSEEVESPSNLAELKNILEEKYPLLKDKTYAFSVNQEVVQTATLTNEDEVALMPPFSGG